MTTELRVRSQAQSLYVRALSQAWRNGIQLHDPSLWLLRDPETEEKMLRDADIAQAVGLRKHLIAGQEWTLNPRFEKSPRSPVAVSVAEELLTGISDFSGALLNLSRAFLSGARFARVHFAPKRLTIGDGRERTWMAPVRLEDLDKRMFRIVPKKVDDRLTAHWERWNVATEKWEPESLEDAANTIRHVYQDDQSSLGHGRGLREALGWWWYAKEHVFQESLQAVERFAQGILTAKVDGARDAGTGMPNTALINAWRDVLEDLRARHVLVYDKSDEIEAVQMNGEGWQLLETIRKELKSTITTLILGANLTTTADSGGSYALADVQENSTDALIKYDRKALEETITKSLLGGIWYQNHANLFELGVDAEKPSFSLAQETKHEPGERATTAKALHEMGVELAVEDVLTQTGFRRPDPGEPIIPKAQPAVDPFGTGVPGFRR